MSATQLWSTTVTISNYEFGTTFYGYNEDADEGSLSDYTVDFLGGARVETIQWGGGSFNKFQIRLTGDRRAHRWDYVTVGSTTFTRSGAQIGYDDVANYTIYQWNTSSNPLGTSGTSVVSFFKIYYYYARLRENGGSIDSDHQTLNGLGVDRYDTSVYPAYYVSTEDGGLDANVVLFRYNPDGGIMPAETVWIALTTSDGTHYDPAKPAFQVSFAESSSLSQASTWQTFTVKGVQVNQLNYFGVYSDNGGSLGSLISGRNFDNGAPSNSTSPSTSYTNGVLLICRLWRINAPTISSISVPQTYDDNVVATINLANAGIGVTSYSGSTTLSEREYAINSTPEEPLSSGGPVWFSSNSFNVVRGVTYWFFARISFNGRNEYNNFEYTIPYLSPELSIGVTPSSQNIAADSTNHQIEITGNSDGNTTYIIRKNGSGNFGQRAGNGIITVSDIPDLGQTETYQVWALLLESRGGAGTLQNTGVTYSVTRVDSGLTFSNLQYPPSVAQGQSVSISVQVSDDGQVTNVTFNEAFNTVNPSVSFSPALPASSTTATATFTAPGTNTDLFFTATATDNQGFTLSTDQFIISVGTGGGDPPPPSGTYGLLVRNNSGQTIIDTSSILPRFVDSGSTSVPSQSSIFVAVSGMSNDGTWEILLFDSQFANSGWYLTANPQSGGFSLYNGSASTATVNYYVFKDG